MVRSGIPGLDDVMGGGLIPKTSMLLNGSPGTGKSIFGLQFLIEGARKYNEPGVYITVEETVDDIRFCARQLGWNIDELEQKGLMTLVDPSQPILEGSVVSIEYISKIIAEKKAKRLVLDSLSLFQYMYSHTNTFKTEIIRFMRNMRSLGVTSIVISERATPGVDDITYSPEDFLFQGMIVLMKLRMQASYERCLNIVKYRGLDHSIRIHPFKISAGGITILTDTTPFALSGGKDR